MRRRDVPRGSEQYEPLEVDPGSAQRGVRARLWAASGTIAVTAVCFAVVVISSLSTFGAIFALTTGLASFGASVGLLMSARHEEEVHEVASRLDAADDSGPADPTTPPELQADGTDGSVADPPELEPGH